MATPDPDPSARPTAPKASEKASTPGDQPDSRRVMLGKLALGASAGAALLAGWPLPVSLFSGPGDAAEAELPFLEVAEESQVTAVPLRVALEAQVRDGWLVMLRELGAAWLMRTPGGIVALSAVCPHLGCGVERDVEGFFCPCHESRFDSQGGLKSGPAQRGLDSLPVRVEKGRVFVQPRMMSHGGSA